MADNKFNNMLNTEDEKRSSDVQKVSTAVKREAIKEFKRREKERLRKHKKFGIKSDLNVPPMNREVPKVEPAIEPAVEPVKPNVEPAIKPNVEPAITPSTSESQKGSHIDLDEIKRVQAEIRREQGLEPEEETAKPSFDDYDASPKIEEPETVTSDDAQESPQDTDQTPNINVNINISVPEGETTIKYDGDSQESSEPLTQKEETYVRKEYEIPDEYKDKDNVSKVNMSEIEELKRQMAIERGEIPPDPIPSISEEQPTEPEAQQPEAEDVVSETITPEALDSQENVETTENTSTTQEPQEKTEERSESIDDDPENKTLASIRRASKRKGERYLAPEESLPDNITDEEIQEMMKHEEIEEEEEEEDYTGMTDEEIAEAKERKRRLKELKARYSNRDAVASGDEGDYRKNLDFTLNTSIKRFRVKPPKKPIIISISAVILFLIVAAVTTLLILNKPPAPIVMSSISLSQNETFQEVGEEIDLRGLYVNCHYTDGSVVKIPVTESMISGKSTNIDEDNIIASFDRNTYIYLTHNNFETMLEITVTNVTLQNGSLSVEIIRSYNQGDVIAYENILLLAQTSTGRTIRLDPSKATYSIGGYRTTHYDDGLHLPSQYSGNTEITISYNHPDGTLTTTITIYITPTL